MPNQRAPLFILSHMRSYSSLLAHVLGSHPEIDGYCETHLRYRFPFDLWRLQWKVRKLTGEPLKGRYVLDKILHNYTISPGVLENPRARAVQLLRNPVDVVQSILHMGTYLHPLERNTDLVQVADYYVSRVQQLAQLARSFGRRAAFVESEALIERTDETLEFLREHLQLNEPLPRRYRRFSKTGKPGFGDPSPAIHSGAIGACVRRPRMSTPIPAEILEAVTNAHQACLEACIRHTVTMQAGADLAFRGHPSIEL